MLSKNDKELGKFIKKKKIKLEYIIKYNNLKKTYRTKNKK